ncbi:hypothetical protein ACFL2J_01290 [Candidatus Omnitrophota bacterium]
MVNSSPKTNEKNHLFIIWIIISFVFSFFFPENNAQARGMGSIDYSTLSIEEIQIEIKLLYQHAKRAYAENDLELSKLFFYKILEFDPEHRGANKYLDFIIPKKIYKTKFRQKQGQYFSLDDKEIEVTKEQKEELQVLEKEVIVSEEKKAVKEKYYKKAINSIPKEEKRKRKLELIQQKRYEAEKRRQEAVQKKEKVRLEREKKLAEKREAEKIEAQKRKEERLRKKELARIVLEEKRKRKKELVNRKKEESEKRKQERKQKKKQSRLEKEQGLAKNRRVASKTEVKKIEEKEAREPFIARKKEVIREKIQDGNKKAQEELLMRIVEKEVAVIKEEQGRLAKEEELFETARRKRDKGKRVDLGKLKRAKRRGSLPLAKLSKKIKKQQTIPKPRAIKSRIGQELGREDLEKYLFEEGEIAESKLKYEESASDKGEENDSQVISEPRQLFQRGRRGKGDSILEGKIQSASQQDKWDNIKAIYNEAIYNYRAGEYDAAQESFSKILE